MSNSKFYNTVHEFEDGKKYIFIEEDLNLDNGCSDCAAEYSDTLCAMLTLPTSSRIPHCSRNKGIWQEVGDVKSIPQGSKLKAHPHATLMLEYAKDMAEDSSIVWQYKTTDDVWRDCTPWWAPTHQFRRKPLEPILLEVEVKICYDIKDDLPEIYVGPEFKTPNVKLVFDKSTGELVSVQKI